MCGCCGRLKENLGSGRVFKCGFENCPRYNVKVHRDGDAARKILARSILEVLFPFPLHEVWSNAHYQSNDFAEEVLFIYIITIFI